MMLPSISAKPAESCVVLVDFGDEPNNETSLRKRTLTLLDLPNDILHYLVRNFLHLKRPQTDEDGDRAPDTIRRLRLVCRLFHHLVSPLLCPTLRISLEQKSLDRAYGLMMNSSIASGVEAIQVELSYRPGKFASDLVSFIKIRECQLTDMVESIERSMEREWRTDTEQGYGTSGTGLSQRRLDLYDRILSSLARARKTEEQRRGRNEECADCRTNFAHDDEHDEYGLLLRQGHERFQELHKQQRQMIENRSFVNTIANLFCNMSPHPVSLNITDRGPGGMGMPQLRKPKDVLSFFASPFTWYQIEDAGLESSDGSSSLLPARILTELPIAMHQSGGVILRRLRIGCMPLQGSFSELQPGNMQQSAPGIFSWSGLREACQQLEAVSVSPGRHNPLRLHHIPAEDRLFLENFLEAVLSSKMLREVGLLLWSFGKHYARLRDKTMKPCPLGAAFRSISWPRARRVHLHGVSLTQDDLEAFCRGMGPEMESLHLSRLQLLDGAWADAVDVLRDKVASPRHRQPGATTVDFNFRQIQGGEFKPTKKSKEGDRPRTVPLLSSSRRHQLDEESDLLMRARQYIMGGLDENPLR